MELTKCIVATTGRGVSTITLNSPARGNPLDDVLINELEHIAYELDAEPKTRIIIVRGAGRHFCSGADLTTDLAAAASVKPVRLNQMLCAFNRMGKPTIAVVHGACVGGGVALAACCDIVIADSNAFFSIPELRLGFPPRPMMPFFVQFFGVNLVRRYCLTAERLMAPEAFRLGLLHRVCDPATQDKAVEEVVVSLLGAAPNAVRVFKEMIHEHSVVSPERFAAAEKAGLNMAPAFNSTEAIEGFRAFLEKRDPDWAQQVPPRSEK